jgi:hypothetical protein
MFFSRLVTVSIAAVAVSGCGGPQHIGAADPTVRRPSTCNNLRDSQRAPQAARKTQMTYCNPTVTSPSGDPDFDVQSFLEIVDSTMAADPCFAQVPRCADLQLSLDDTIYADPGGPAKRGDNCTPVNGYAIGYSLGGGTQKTIVTAPNAPISGDNSLTIVNQSTLFAIDPTGNQTSIGWVLYTAGGQAYFVPNLVAAFGVTVTSFATVAPSAYPISINSKSSRLGTNAVRGIFAQIGNSTNTAILSSFLNLLKSAGSVTNTPCNSSPIQTA